MPTKTRDLISMVESLPIQTKTKLIERILNSLHPTQKEIDQLWAKEVEKRVAELKAGKARAISGDKVFQKIREKLGR